MKGIHHRSGREIEEGRAAIPSFAFVFMIDELSREGVEQSNDEQRRISRYLYVYDSVPEREYLETENKMGACLHAIAAISGSDEVG